MARAGNNFAGRFALGWIPACAGMTDCGRVPDPLAKKQPMTFRSSFPTARGYAGPPEEANVIPAEAGIQSGWLGALSRSSRYTVRRPSGGRHSMTAVRAPHAGRRVAQERTRGRCIETHRHGTYEPTEGEPPGRAPRYSARTASSRRSETGLGPPPVRRVHQTAPSNRSRSAPSALMCTRGAIVRDARNALLRN